MVTLLPMLTNRATTLEQHVPETSRLPIETGGFFSATVSAVGSVSLQQGNVLHPPQWESSSLRLTPGSLLVSQRESGSAPLLPHPVGSSKVIELSTARGVRSVATAKGENLTSRLWAIVLSKALQTQFPVTRACVDLEEDREEGTKGVVLRVYTDASSVQTFAFWDGLVTDLNAWSLRLSHHERQLLLGSVGLRFHWRSRENV